MIPSMFFPPPTQARTPPNRGRFLAARQVPASECAPLANGIDLSLLQHTAQSNGTMSCSTANISSIGSSSTIAGAQKGSSLAYKITRISLVPSLGGQTRLSLPQERDYQGQLIV